MSRSTTTTIGFLLILIGVQLNLIDSYTLTPRASKFVAQRLNAPGEYVERSYDNVQSTVGQVGQYAPNQYNNSPFSQAGYTPSYNQSMQPPAYAADMPYLGPPQVIRPPEWICWPVLFLGAVLCLHSFLRR